MRTQEHVYVQIRHVVSHIRPHCAQYIAWRLHPIDFQRLLLELGLEADTQHVTMLGVPISSDENAPRLVLNP